ncbi:hypothetical protein TcasGA2_TC034789 [Tribolium castaneum]|uniref:Uncharacterized protein n=1 Tax=Tribolium castaneum TaxID=7070 RepID=A0A139WE66_TRICA|nr:hypothetical protein TcasGA2_TC034789 [Tribolium castaneum]
MLRHIFTTVVAGFSLFLLQTVAQFPANQSFNYLDDVNITGPVVFPPAYYFN